jgi:hypothetical protein
MGLLFGSGVSAEADVFRAGQQAALNAIKSLKGDSPSLILVFSSIRFADPRMLKGVRSVTGDAPLIGCTDAASICAAGPRRRSVCVVAISLSTGQVITAVGRHLSQNAGAAGSALAEAIRRENPETPKALFVFPDGLAANSNELLRSIETTLGFPVPILGAAAADDFFFQKTFQYYNDEILTDAVPAALLCGDVKIGVGSRHGWMPLGRSREVTRAKGHVIYQLDGHPAISIYEDYLGLRKEEMMEETLARIAITYPLGKPVNGYAEYILRDAIRVGKAGSLICTADLDEGSHVRLMIGGYESALEAAQQAALEAVEQIPKAQIRGALVFSSVARQKRLGSEFQGEIDVIRDVLGGANVTLGGFYSYGEFAPIESSRRGRRRWHNEFQNQSVVVVTLG